jgi:hypothetical protein
MLLTTILAAAVAATPVPVDTMCIWNQSTMPGRGPITIPDASRRSPRDSVSFRVGNGTVKVCYSRPAMRGRRVFGDSLVPYGRVWRTGANEATMLITTADIMVAGMHVPAGIYALYTVPGPQEWEVILNRSYMQWGHESTYTDSVRAMELGRRRVRSGTAPAPVEQFTISATTEQGGNAQLVLAWEGTRVAIPVRRM